MEEEEEKEGWDPPSFIEECDIIDTNVLNFDVDYNLPPSQTLLNTRLVFTADEKTVYKPLTYLGSGEEWLSHTSCA